MWHRKRLIVDWRIQLRYALTLVVPAAILGGLLFWSVHKLGNDLITCNDQKIILQKSTLLDMHRNITETDMEDEHKGKLLKQLHYLQRYSNNLRMYNFGQWKALSRILFWGYMIVILGTAYIILAFSNRIFGPFKRLKKNLNIMANGDLSQKLTTRKTDELHDIFNAIEAVRHNIHQSVQEYDTTLKAVSKFINGIDIGTPGNEMQSNMAKSLEKLKNDLNKHYPHLTKEK